MRYDWDWSVLWHYRAAFVIGAAWTLLLSASAIILGTALGVVWGLLLSTHDRAWLETRWFAHLCNDVVRALPLLVLLLIVNYYAPYAFGLRSLFWIACATLALNLSAFIADVLRGAIAGVPRPLREAGLALGMSDLQVLQRIVLPEALRATVPSIFLLYIHILKMSSLASIIAFPELSHIGGEVSSVAFRPLEVFALIAMIYTAIVVPLSLLQRRLERSKWLVRRS